nr:type II secretion system protein [Vibrio fortis]
MSLVRVTKLKIAVASTTLILASLLGFQAFSSNVSETEEAKLIINYLDQILDATHQYAIDNGSLPPITLDTDANFGYLNINDLVENPGLSTWQGPYLPFDDTWIGGDQYISHPDYIAAQILLKEKDSSWVRGSSETGCQPSSEACSLAACIWLVPLGAAQEVNHMIDGELNTADSDAKGTIRFEKAMVGSLVCKIGDDYPLPE